MARKKTIIFCGGGTMGSVTPLLAAIDELKQRELGYDFLWVGSQTGPERQVMIQEGLAYKAIASGKLRRYWSTANFTDLGQVIKGFGQSFWLLLTKRPKLIVAAGSFIAVPVVMAGKILGIPSLVHQLDYQPGLANKIMAKFAKKVTVTFLKSRQDYGDKAEWLGSLIRQSLQQPLDKTEALEFFGLQDDLPVLLVLGGGTGSTKINQLVTEDLTELSRFCQVLHLTGQNKETDAQAPNYHSFSFLHDQDMALAYAAADLVISRAGMGALTELSYLGKPTIIIPMPKSHQELNAKSVQGGNAAIVLDENKLSGSELSVIIQEVIYNHKLLSQMSQNIAKAFKIGNERLVEIIQGMAK